MEFLKSILGEELFTKFVAAINAYNGDEANKDKQVKIANLGEGNYVSKDKYTALETTLNGKQTELDTANTLIADLKKGTKGNEDLQGKITAYDQQVKDLQKELNETKLKSAIKVALLADKANDVDYLTFKLESKLKEDNKNLELDENGNIKGWKEMSESLRTEFPNQFAKADTNTIEPNKLPSNNNKDAQPVSLSEALKAHYTE